ncbi:MAG: hypothetical protein BWY74_02672 [Firmicutes bacterium ADurb.Bin419]|nr:MAG: hypothetical protein BWY74_02672 [Firmicutes bacterium ADurb.Bin419]
MTYRKKIFLYGIILLSFVCIILVIINSIYYKTFSKSEVINSYTKNEKYFLNVALYLIDMEGLISINKQSKNSIEATNFLNGNYSNVILDNSINNQIEYILNKLDYSSITERDNSVIFKKVTVDELERGIVFSEHGQKPNWPGLVQLETIKEKLFYYEKEKE